MCICYFTATFDVQNPTAEGNGSGITVTGEFITDSSAAGCFIVLQGNENTADTYRAIPRNGAKTIYVPSGTYTVYAYDIEDDGLPYTLPANTPDNGLNITTNCKYDIQCIYSYKYM